MPTFAQFADKVLATERSDPFLDREIAMALGYRVYVEPARMRMAGDGMIGKVLHTNKQNVPGFTSDVNASHRLAQVLAGDLYVEPEHIARLTTAQYLQQIHARGFAPRNRGDDWEPKEIVRCHQCGGFVPVSAKRCARCGHAP